MEDKESIRGGRKNRWPLGFDIHDPEGWAEFALGLGYEPDNVVKSLVEKCNVEPLLARRIVADVARDKGVST
jgi:hypothetical protein